MDFTISSLQENYRASSLSGFFSLRYMAGWLCSIVALYRVCAAGNSNIGKSILVVQVALLSLGEAWKVYAIVQPAATTVLFKTLDLFWPVSNCFMLFTGLAVLFSKQVRAWKRYIPLVVGLWFPITLFLVPRLLGGNTVTLYISSFYSAVGWLLLGISVYSSARTKKIIYPEETIARLQPTA
jgi:hypothetical protein